MSLAFDISGWQGRPNPAWFQQMKAAGYELGYIQLWGSTPNGSRTPNPHAAYQLEQTRLAGMLTGGYIVIYPDVTDDTSVLIQVALQAAGPEVSAMSFIAPDIEPSSPLRMSRLLNARTNIKSQTQGKLIAVYTSREYWRKAFGSFDAPYPYAAEDPLLEARYYLPSGQAPDVPPDLDWKWTAFGGWTQRAMLQYAGTTPTFGVGTDRNTFDHGRMRLIPHAPPVEGEHMPTPEYNEIQQQIASLDQRINGHAATPHGAAVPAPAPTVKNYTVVGGDTASGIAQKNGISLSTLTALNPGKPRSGNWNVIYPGEVFRVG